ncbi:MAG: ParB/RepB/Spo0J family partition protein [Actinobacteria bacterium]|nr:ParB/RepB/Spo0J family partition protein [Actinomycetota bacterium]
MSVAEELSARNASPVVRVLSTALLHPWSTMNPRKRFDESGLAELAESIRRHGVIEPLIAMKPRYPGTVGYSIVCGERRWRAAKLAGVDMVPVIVRETMTDEEALELALVENLQRADLDPIEAAEGFQRLREMGKKQTEIAAAVHKSQEAISNSVRLLGLPAEVRKLISDGKLSAAHGRALASYKDFPAVVSRLATWASDQGWPSKDLEKGLPNHMSLENTGLVVDIEYSRAKPECAACPFDAIRKGQTWGRFCLKPEHYRELDEAEKAAERTKTELAISEAQARGVKVPKLDELRGAQYRRLGDPGGAPPAGCREDCEHRRQVIDFGGHKKLVTICVDVSCHETLRAAEEKASKKGKAERQKELQGQLAERLDQVGAVSSRELAILVASALVAAAPSIVKRAYTRATGHAEEFIPKAIYGGSDERRHSHELLAVLSPTELVRLGVEVLLADEIHFAYANQYVGKQETRRTNWYLEGEKPGATPSARRDPPAPVQLTSAEQAVLASESEDARLQSLTFQEADRRDFQTVNGKTVDSPLDADLAVRISRDVRRRYLDALSRGKGPVDARYFAIDGTIDANPFLLDGRYIEVARAVNDRLDSNDTEKTATEPRTENPEPAPAACEAGSAWAISCHIADGSTRMMFPCEDHKAAMAQIAGAMGQVKAVYELTPASGKGKLVCGYQASEAQG